MDALPIQEENGFEYASANPGKMHACGHDGHTTIALGVAKLFSQRRDEIAGRIKFVFQPAEEIVGGAKAMVADGVLQNPRPDVTLGLHLWNRSPLGWVGVGDGPVMAGAGTFKIVVHGKGGHGASPHLSIDPVVCAAHLITAFQSIVSRNVNPLDNAVISVTKLQAGTATNIIPEEVELQGTIRTFKPEILDLVKRRMTDLSEAIAKAMECSTSVTITDGTKPVSNDAEVASRVREALGRVVNPDGFDYDERTMGAEDVGLLMDDIPGMYFFVGAEVPGQTEYYGHHHPRFDFDENALPLSVALMSSAVAEYVLR
jgi:amidohydrolase